MQNEKSLYLVAPCMGVVTLKDVAALPPPCPSTGLEPASTLPSCSMYGRIDFEGRRGAPSCPSTGLELFFWDMR